MRTVQVFGAMRAALGRDDITVAVPEPVSDQELLTALSVQHPLAAPWCGQARVAVDDDFVRGALPPGPVAVIPPVSGG